MDERGVGNRDMGRGGAEGSESGKGSEEERVEAEVKGSLSSQLFF